ncbi:MAG TPA: DeoR/GlpR family DNA-binding transcription regulator [Chloroflexota bacterium]|nr:DeoR/GlpR family DNA-binding transcription regulator [Chloroflexota bacterium]
MVNQAARRERILTELGQSSVIYVHEIASRIGCSLSTARRDLDTLASLGLLQRSRGGAIATDPASARSARLSTDHEVRAAEKLRIGRAAAELVTSGDSIAVGGGSTTCALVRALAGKQLSVVTNALGVVLEALPLTGLRVVLLAGEVLTTREIVGPLTEETLARLHIDTVFMSVNGVSVDKGGTVMSHLDAQVLQAMAGRARRVVVLADHSKIGRAALTQILPITAIHTLVTDATAEDPALAAIRDAGVQVILV